MASQSPSALSRYSPNGFLTNLPDVFERTGAREGEAISP
jgi:hypothetical protein